MKKSKISKKCCNKHSRNTYRSTTKYWNKTGTLKDTLNTTAAKKMIENIFKHFH